MFSVKVDFWRKVRYSSVFHPNLPKYLTPHVLSEWMVEVCRFDKYRYQVHVGVDEYPVLFVFRAGVRF